ncbi:MAG: reverse transcriptase-like protein [Candidatus Bipolaricaulota bacterium]|jgi:ribonuclease HI|nr:reverse transcriptase-like protein [Candidatus Bipolaricaulota bacterium]
MEKVFVYVDGRARNGPGEAGIGIAITDKDGNVLEEVSRLIGRTTSEVAEYRALIEGCRRAHAYSPQSAIFFVANQNLANEVNGLFGTRQPHLRHLVEVAKALLNEFPQWRVNLIDSDANRLALRLVEQAFHSRIQAQMTRERLELRLLARASRLTDEEMEELIAYAERLQGKG